MDDNGQKTSETKGYIERSLIEALKDIPRSKQELTNIIEKVRPGLSKDARRKRITRFLENLRNLGLIEKRGDKYCWYLYITVFRDREDYEAKLRHSSTLIPVLKHLAGIIWPEPVMLGGDYVTDSDWKILREYAIDHLRVYSEIWAHVDPLRKLREEAETENGRLIKKLGGKLKEEFRGEPIVESVDALKRRGIVIANVCKVICYTLVHGSQLVFRLDETDLMFNGTLVARADRALLNKVKSFIKDELIDSANREAAHHISDIEQKAFAIQPTLEYEIRKLILKVEAGEPLAGTCNGCPKLYFTS